MLHADHLLDDPLLQKIHDNEKQWTEQYELSVLYLNGFERDQTNLYSNNKFPFFFTTKKSCNTINCHANPPYAFLLDKRGFIMKEGVKEPEIYRLLGV